MVHCSLRPPVLAIFSTRHRISTLPSLSAPLQAWRLNSTRSAAWNAFWSLQLKVPNQQQWPHLPSARPPSLALRKSATLATIVRGRDDLRQNVRSDYVCLWSLFRGVFALALRTPTGIGDHGHQLDAASDSQGTVLCPTAASEGMREGHLSSAGAARLAT